MNTAAALFLPLLLFAAAVADGWIGVFLESNEPRVTEVIPDSPAAKAGIQAGDLFLAVGDTATKTTNEFAAAVRACKAGDRVRVKLQREGNEMTVVVRVAERPAEEEIPAPREERGEAEKKPEPKKPAPAGETGKGGKGKGEKGEKGEKETKGFDDFGPAEQPQDGGRGFLGVEVDDADDGGVLVVRPLPGSPAAEAGIAAGDVIVKIGDDAIGNRDALEGRMAKTKPGEKLAVQLRSGGGTKAVVVTLGGRPAEAGGALAPRRPRAREEEPKPRTKVEGKGEKAEAGEAPRDGAKEARIARTFGTDFAKARKQAEASGKPLLVAYGASWNSGSQAQRRVLAAEGVAEALEKFVCVYVDADKNSALLEERGVQELPVIEVLRGDKTVARVDGYVPPEKVLAFLEKAAGGEGAKAKESKAKEPKEPKQPKAAKQKDEAKRDAAPRERGDGDRAALEEELQALRKELAEIRKMLEELRREKGRE